MSKQKLTPHKNKMSKARQNVSHSYLRDEESDKLSQNMFVPKRIFMNRMQNMLILKRIFMNRTQNMLVPISISYKYFINYLKKLLSWPFGDLLFCM
jgi:hypothetical protein